MTSMAEKNIWSECERCQKNANAAQNSNKTYYSFLNNKVTMLLIKN